MRAIVPRVAVRRAVVTGLMALVAAACGSDGDDTTGTTDPPTTAQGAVPFVAAVVTALAAVDDLLGGPQEYFEVTANPQFTNVFVAVDDATATVPYLYVDGVLEAPGPRREGATGNTFTAADVDFDPEAIVAGVAAELPETSIDALSVYGDGRGAVYVLAATSEVGGRLDIVVTGEGAVVSVDPL